MKSYWKVIAHKEIDIAPAYRKNKYITSLVPNELFTDGEKKKWIHPDFHKYLKLVKVEHATFAFGARWERPKPVKLNKKK